MSLQTFEFDIATIEIEETGWLRKQTELIVKKSRQQALHFIEGLENDLGVEMVAIPEGSFIMGSSENELGHRSSEGPQHLVSIQPFFLGQYPVTQAQWRAVAILPPVNRPLLLEPSHFNGGDAPTETFREHPVECVSWYDAVEFCDRLSRETGKPYRLPSEAEWEYACRAGTTTPFHFGETITTDLANYRGDDDRDSPGSGSYGKGPKGIYRGQTTPVGSFGVANRLGLYDMHGNVWQWCADRWQDNYEKMLNNGNVKLSSDRASWRVLRGGSWNYNPSYCRSASRLFFAADDRHFNIGFRIATTAV